MTGPLDDIPLWVVFAGCVGLVLLSIEAGARQGRCRRRRSEDKWETLVSSVAAAALTLLGLLAFTFGLAASRLNARRQLLVREANAIGTSILRGGLMPADRARPVRDLLARDSDSRLEVTETLDFERSLRQADELHNLLWPEAESLGRQHPDSIVVGLFIPSLNETIDVHAERVLPGIQGWTPIVLWGASI